MSKLKDISTSGAIFFAVCRGKVFSVSMYTLFGLVWKKFSTGKYIS